MVRATCPLFDSAFSCTRNLGGIHVPAYQITTAMAKLTLAAPILPVKPKIHHATLVHNTLHLPILSSASLPVYRSHILRTCVARALDCYLSHRV